MNGIVTLLTDFGTQDSYVAEMKGRLLSLGGSPTLVDITHDIAPGDVPAAAWVLSRAWRTFPPDTVHLVVVDPGVGTARRALAVRAGGHAFVGPDNGVLETALALPDAAAVALATPPGAAATFHGRDVFAPAAAALASATGRTPRGVPVADPVRLTLPAVRRAGAMVSGEVVHVDRFGTLITNIPGDLLETGATVRVGAVSLPMRATFADVPPGRPVAFVGSAGTVEIAVRGGRADERLGLQRGAAVRAAAGDNA